MVMRGVRYFKLDNGVTHTITADLFVQLEKLNMKDQKAELARLATSKPGLPNAVGCAVMLQSMSRAQRNRLFNVFSDQYQAELARCHASQAHKARMRAKLEAKRAALLRSGN
jgi:hypothetical protein